MVILYAGLQQRSRGFGAPAAAWTRPRQIGTRRLTRRRTPMSVLVVVQGNPRPDRTDTLQQYQQTARAVIAKHGGEVVARGSGFGRLSGSREGEGGGNRGLPHTGPGEAGDRGPELPPG